ncbi:MAG: DNA-directed RNA polymerase subunit alpha [Planctomycetaceae bacterium]|nr:MAG: DNA-directed RNA polymerase subunit alpha [Planctomycetaceae bacterium]
MIATVKESVNIHEILHATTPLAPEDIRDLEAAVSGGQITELRQEAYTLVNDVDSGDKSKAKITRAGLAFFLLGQGGVAESLFLKAAGDGLAEFYRGQALVGLGRYAEAAESFESAAKHGSDKVMCLLLEAGAMRGAGDRGKAEELLKQAASQGGATRAEYSYQMGCVLAEKGDTFGAVEYFSRAVDMDPGHQRALFWLAQLNAQRGNDEDAIRLYERALAKPPLHLGALLNLGLLYEDAENYPAAAYCFRRAIDVDGTHARARLYLKDIESTSDMYYDEESQRMAQKQKQVLLTPVTDFEMSVRARNCLQKMGVRSLDDLTRLTEHDLLAGKNFGETSLREIKEMLESKGLRLGMGASKDKPRDYGIQETLTREQQALLNRPVAELNLSVRARKCMTRLQIATLGELIARTPDELLESKNFGVTSLNEVRGKLNDLGLRLRND